MMALATGTESVTRLINATRGVVARWASAMSGAARRLPLTAETNVLRFIARRPWYH